MTPLEFHGVSKNLKYIFFNKGVYSLVEDKSYTYESLPLSKGVEMLKEVFQLEYLQNKITLDEHLSSPRKTLISLMEMLSVKNSITIIKEWETNYGNKLLLINESTDKLLLEENINNAWDGVITIVEATYNPFKKDFWSMKNVKGIGQDIKSGVKKSWDWIKNKAMSAWKCLTNNFIECFMEGFRSALYSIVGVSIETFLAVTGIGAPIPMIAWGLMLVWDIYKMFSGKYESGQYQWGWDDIIFDVLGIVTAGSLSAILGPMRSGLRGTKSLGSVVTKLSKSKGAVGNAVRGLGKTLSNQVPKITSAMRSAGEWVSKNFGIKSISNWVGKATKFIEDLAVKMGASQKVGKGIAKTTAVVAPVAALQHATGINPVTGKPYDGGTQSSADIESEINTLTTGSADYEAAGVF